MTSKQKSLFTVVFVSFIGILISIVMIGSFQNRDSQNELAMVQSLDQETVTQLHSQVEEPTTAPILYWGTTCPYCHDVLDWIKEELPETVYVPTKEVYEDQRNAAELGLRAESCGMNPMQVGVPLLFTPENECLVGAPDIIEYLERFNFVSIESAEPNNQEKEADVDETTQQDLE